MWTLDAWEGWVLCPSNDASFTNCHRCATLSGTTKCVSCYNHYHLHVNGTCLQSCPTGYFPERPEFVRYSVPTGSVCNSAISAVGLGAVQAWGSLSKGEDSDLAASSAVETMRSTYETFLTVVHSNGDAKSYNSAGLIATSGYSQNSIDYVVPGKFDIAAVSSSGSIAATIGEGVAATAFGSETDIAASRRQRRTTRSACHSGKG